jgi:hypothetical protein
LPQDFATLGQAAIDLTGQRRQPFGDGFGASVEG